MLERLEISRKRPPRQDRDIVAMQVCRSDLELILHEPPDWRKRQMRM